MSFTVGLLCLVVRSSSVHKDVHYYLVRSNGSPTPLTVVSHYFITAFRISSLKCEGLFCFNN